MLVYLNVFIIFCSIFKDLAGLSRPLSYDNILKLSCQHFFQNFFFKFVEHFRLICFSSAVHYRDNEYYIIMFFPFYNYIFSCYVNLFLNYDTFSPIYSFFLLLIHPEMLSYQSLQYLKILFFFFLKFFTLISNCLNINIS